jgi:hypothetical protein
MAAVLLDEAGAADARGALEGLRNDFRLADGSVMSWKEHVKTHDRRRRAAEVLGGVSGLRVCYVYALKSALRSGSYLDDPERFYNYVALKVYKSALWAARSWKGPHAQVWTRFGHVRRHDHRSTERYIRRESTLDRKVPDGMEQGLRWVSADRYAESQAADIYAGFMQAALWPHGEFGYVEPVYLLSVWHQIRNSDTCAIPLGIMSMPDRRLIRKNPWFPCTQCTR